MLEGAAFAFLQEQIKDREQAAYSAAIKEFHAEREELLRMKQQAELTQTMADQELKHAQAYEVRVRKQLRRAVRSAEIYEATVQRIKDRIEDMLTAVDGLGISNDLNAIIAMIDKALRSDPYFQGG